MATCRGPKGAAGTVSLRLRFHSFGDGGDGGGGLIADEAVAGRMGAPVAGCPPVTILSSQWRSLQVWGAVTVESPPTGIRRCCPACCAARRHGTQSKLLCCTRPSILQREVVSAAADAMFDPVAFIDNPATDTQAWLFWNPGARQLCLAFRGTEQAKWQDILTDLSLVPASLDPEGIAERAWQRPRQPAQGAAEQLLLEEAMVRCAAFSGAA